MSEPELDYIHPQLRHMAMPIADLTPDPKNARKHGERNQAALRSSMEQFGMRGPIIAQRTGDKVIVRAGNNRMAQALKLGWTHLPVLVFDEGDQEAIAFAIADNRTAELAEWDYSALNSQLDAISDDYDLNDIGWNDDELSVVTMEFNTNPTNFDDGAADVKPKIVGSNKDDIDPDEIEDYDEEKDFFIVKVADVPPSMKEAVVEAVNDTLAGLGDGTLKAIAY